MCSPVQEEDTDDGNGNAKARAMETATQRIHPQCARRAREVNRLRVVDRCSLVLVGADRRAEADPVQWLGSSTVRESVAHFAEIDVVARTHFDVVQDPPAIEERAVHRTEIAEPPPSVAVAQHCVPARDGGVDDDAIAFARASEGHAVSRRQGKKRRPGLAPDKPQACRPPRKTKNRGQNEATKRTTLRKVD